MSDLKLTLVDAYNKGELTHAIHDALVTRDIDEQVIASTIASAHNEKLLDAAAAFMSLKNDNTEPDFFLVRSVFEGALPYFNTEPRELLGCLVHLYREAGQDMAASMVLTSFAKYCEKDLARSKSILKEIEKNTQLYVDLLIPTLQGGYVANFSEFLSETFRLIKSEDVELLRRATLSLSNIQWSKNGESPELVLNELEEVVNHKTDEKSLAAVVLAAFATLESKNPDEPRVISIISSALTFELDSIMHSAAQIFAFSTEKLPASLEQLLLQSLSKVKPDNLNTLRMIGTGVTHLLKIGKIEASLQLIEKLIKNNNGVKLEVFGSVSSAIASNAVLRSKVITRWLMSGSVSLGNSAFQLTKNGPVDGMEIAIDPSETDMGDIRKVVYLSRKILGFFFLRPISAASLIVSMVQNTNDDKALEELGKLLRNPLLLNYTGKVKDYVQLCADKESGKVQEILSKAIEWVSSYLNVLHSVGELNALNVSSSHREAYSRHMNVSMFEAMKEAEKSSILLELVSKSTLLYTDRSVNYIYGPSGEKHRTELDLQSHGIEFEVPRQDMIDPCGLDYLLRMYKAEKLEMLTV